MALEGHDPRTWDLRRLLAAFESSVRQNAKDDAAWQRTFTELTAEPKEVKQERLRQGVRAGPPKAGMSVDAAESLLARFAASEALYR